MLKDFKYKNRLHSGFSKETALGAGVPLAVIDEVILSEKWENIRSTRQKLISETDWTQITDAPLSIEKKSEFSAYRQALRDIPQNYTHPDDVIWPEKPSLV